MSTVHRLGAEIPLNLAAADAAETQAFWACVDIDKSQRAQMRELGPCWMWKGRTSRNGHGLFLVVRLDGLVRADRYSYELRFGSTSPSTPFIGSKCARLACVNPAHLVASRRVASTEILRLIAEGRSYAEVMAQTGASLRSYPLATHARVG